MSKGSARRPAAVPDKELETRWSETFPKPAPPKEAPK